MCIYIYLLNLLNIPDIHIPVDISINPSYPRCITGKPQLPSWEEKRKQNLSRPTSCAKKMAELGSLPFKSIYNDQLYI